MKHYNPINLWEMTSADIVPSMTGQRTSFQCFHCRHTTVIPIPNEYTDWEKVANDYKVMLQRIVDSNNQAIADMELIHGNDNPVIQYYANQWAMLRLQMLEHFGQKPKGTSANTGEDDNEQWKHTL